MTSLKTKINSFSSVLNKKITEINKTLTKRKNNYGPRITFKDIHYFSSKLVTNKSYSITNLNMKADEIKTATDMAFCKRRTMTDIKHFESINTCVLQHIYKNASSRFLAVDGSQINLDKSLAKYGYKLSRNKEYCTAILSAIFDVETKCPISYELSKGDEAESEILIRQLDNLNPTDTLIMDRGYYSKKLVFELHKRKINYIFRMRNNSSLNPQKNNNEELVTIIKQREKINAKTVKYYVEKEEYYLLTSFLNYDIKTLSKLYWQRWTVETHFRHIKKDIIESKLRSKTHNTIQIDIKCIHFLGMLVSFIENLKEINKTKVKINSTDALRTVADRILILMFYKNKSGTRMMKLLKIIDLIHNNTTNIVMNRTFIRRRVTPATKWNINGNTYIPKSQRAT
jgi:hypothetical protein